MKKVPEGWARVCPAVFYEDASKAIDWLCRAFGFEVQLKVEGEGGRIEHSELRFGEGLVMVSQAGGSSARKTPLPTRSPRAVGGVNTQMLAHLRRRRGRALRAGARRRGEDPRRADHQRLRRRLLGRPDLPRRGSRGTPLVVHAAGPGSRAPWPVISTGRSPRWRIRPAAPSSSGCGEAPPPERGRGRAVDEPPGDEPAPPGPPARRTRRPGGAGGRCAGPPSVPPHRAAHAAAGLGGGRRGDVGRSAGRVQGARRAGAPEPPPMTARPSRRPGASDGAGGRPARRGVPGLHRGDRPVVAARPQVPGGRRQPRLHPSRATAGRSPLRVVRGARGPPGSSRRGRCTVWEPPSRLAFEWRGIAFAPGERTEVEVLFAPSPSGTSVTVTHRGWASLRPDHPVRHGHDVPAFIRMTRPVVGRSPHLPARAPRGNASGKPMNPSTVRPDTAGAAPGPVPRSARGDGEDRLGRPHLARRGPHLRHAEGKLRRRASLGVAEGGAGRSGGAGGSRTRSASSSLPTWGTRAGGRLPRLRPGRVGAPGPAHRAESRAPRRRSPRTALPDAAPTRPAETHHATPVTPPR